MLKRQVLVGRALTGVLWRKRVVKATLLTFIGALVFAGCSAGSSSPSYGSNDLELSKYSGDLDQTRRYIFDRAKQEKIPDQFVSEARIGIAEVAAAMAAAHAADVEREAIRDQSHAEIGARLEEANAAHEIAVAEAERLRSQYVAKQNQLLADVNARQRNVQTTADQKETLVAALAKERNTLQSDVISQANQDFAEATARIEELKKVRAAIEQESTAAVSNMRESAKATRTRAKAMVSALRVEAKSIHEQTEASLGELEIHIQTVRQQAMAESNRLATKAESIAADAQASVRELRARAEAVSVQASDEQYQLKMTAADMAVAQAQALSDHRLAQGENTFARSIAEVELIRGDSDALAQHSETEFKQGVGELDAWFQDAQAEIQPIWIGFDRKEKVPRAEFVKVEVEVEAEAEARAEALRETASHKQEVAEKQMKHIIAEAEAEAARLHELFLVELAERQANDSVERSGKTAPAPEQPEGLHDVPEAPKVVEVTPRLEPQHVADYRGALAEVMRDRAKADSKQLAIEATYAESLSKLEAIKSQKRAMAAEQVAIADAMQTQAEAQFAKAKAQVEAAIQTAQANHRRAIVEADAFRRVTQAEVSDLQAQATTKMKVSGALATELRSESEATAKQAEAEAKALEAKLRAVKQRGKAEFARLMTEADSVERSQKALAGLIDAQITAAKRTMAAELTELDQTIDSQGTVAKATYEEAIVRANVVGQQTEIAIARVKARNEMEKSLAEAHITRAQNLLYINQRKGEAEVDRMMAAAKADWKQALAAADAREASIFAESEGALAEVKAQRRVAKARQEAVKALFDARLVQVSSNRTREMTDQFRNDWFRRTNLESALAEAEAAREASRQRLAELQEQQKALEGASLKDWDVHRASLRRYDRAPDTTIVQRDVQLPGQVHEDDGTRFSEVPTD